jgi:serine-type D-Ala-D-Ala carboxypeptidase (penicillin-binding protein 5/6)
MMLKRRSRWPWVLGTVALAALLIATASVVTIRLGARLPPASVRIDAPATLAVGGASAPPIPTPARGSFALSTSVDGSVATHDSTVERPIGSVAKGMTALVVLSIHPLAPGESGPSLTMTSADVVLYRRALAQDGSAVPVRAGEILTERDLLLALLLPSANNIAETLAVWASGNRSAFIARLNATAAGMGMDHSYFADPSGLSAMTVSTAADLALLAQTVIANPAIAELVAVRQARLPDGTILHNLDILLGQQPGWLGIKTGWTGAAGGCLLFAARGSYAPNETVTVWGAVLGQPPSAAADRAHPELGGAFAAARSAVVAALKVYVAVDLAGLLPAVTGSIATRWGSRARVVLSEQSGDVEVVRSGAVLHLTVTTLRPVAPFGSGVVVGRVTCALNATTTVTWRVVSSSAIAGPSLWWKLFSA